MIAQLKYAISLNFNNDKELVDNFLAWYEMASRKQKRIFIYLHTFCRKHNLVFPSQDRIAEKAGCGREWVNRTLKKLEELGFLIKKRRPYRSCLYLIADVLLRLDLNNIEIFRKTPIGYEQCEHLSTQNCLGKSHNRDHKTDHHNRTYFQDSRSASLEQNVGVRREQFDQKRGFVFGTDAEKVRLLGQYLKKEKDIKYFLRFGLTSIELAIRDYKSAGMIQYIGNVPAFLTTHCKVYDDSFRLNITYKEAWEMHHAAKKQKGKR